MANEERKRELVLPPGTHAFILDGTKGLVKLYVGPVVINPGNADKPVIFDQKEYKFTECTLESAMKQNIVVPEGYYVVLTNPAKGTGGKLIYPEIGRSQDTPDLFIGLKENIPGPVNFALFPGQTAEVRRGHHLRSNEYLRVKVYNADKARENWTKAVIKTVAPDPAALSNPPVASSTPSIVASDKAPEDLTVGKQYNILGTEASFYIPPTGVSVVSEDVIFSDGSQGFSFIRGAETLEKLEYSILVDEDGNKEYPRGEMVVFPKPTQQFMTDPKNPAVRKFKAIEMNELQGIQLKFITDVTLTFADGSKKQFKAGDETFITGKEMPIYYPEEGHQLVRYDGKTLHYAAAVPLGEARYVMNRKTGEIRTVKGPTMLLPNPVEEIIVRRALSDFETMTMFPGSDGTGSKEALEYNRMLRIEATKEPTTRQGVVSEGRIDPTANGGEERGVGEVMYAMSTNAPTSTRQRSSAKSSFMAESRQGKDQSAVLGDVSERKSTFNEPRSITFAGKYKGVPTIKVQPGYAVNVVDTDGKREVVVGPKTRLLDFGAVLDPLSLSTGKPKSTDRLFRTCYLNVSNNKITDIIEVESSDHVVVTCKVVYNVNFEGDSSKWFSIENYVKHLCDHVRSILKGKVRKQTVEAFYASSTDLIRDMILGVAPAPSADTTAPTPKRPGRAFPENGMRITDVEVLGVVITDQNIAQLLARSQHQVVQQNINLSLAKKQLEVTQEQEKINQAILEAQHESMKFKKGLETDQAEEDTAFRLRKMELNMEVAQQEITDEAARNEKRLTSEKETITLQKMVSDLQAALDLADAQASVGIDKLKSDAELAADTARQTLALQAVDAQTKAIADQLKSIQPGLIEAMLATGAADTLVKVAQSLSFHQMFGAKNGVEFLKSVFANTPIEALISKTLDRAGSMLPSGQNGGQVNGGSARQ